MILVKREWAASVDTYALLYLRLIFTSPLLYYTLLLCPLLSYILFSCSKFIFAWYYPFNLHLYLCLFFYFLSQVLCASFLFNIQRDGGKIFHAHSLCIPHAVISQAVLSTPIHTHTRVTANPRCPLLTRTQEMHYHIRLCGRLPHAQQQQQQQTFCKLRAGCCHMAATSKRHFNHFQCSFSIHPTILNMWPNPFAIIMFKSARCWICIDNNLCFLLLCW